MSTLPAMSTLPNELVEKLGVRGHTSPSKTRKVACPAMCPLWVLRAVFICVQPAALHMKYGSLLPDNALVAANKLHVNYGRVAIAQRMHV